MLGGRAVHDKPDPGPAFSHSLVCLLAWPGIHISYLPLLPSPPKPPLPQQPTSAAGMPTLLPLQVHGVVPCVQNFLSCPAPVGMQPSQPSTCPCLGSLLRTPVQCPECSPLPTVYPSEAFGFASCPGLTEGTPGSCLCCFTEWVFASMPPSTPVSFGFCSCPEGGAHLSVQ